jgi:transcriptional regulator with XRE-family HTH domain
MFYVFQPGRRIVVLDGVVKKQTKIPGHVLKRVRGYQRDLESRRWVSPPAEGDRRPSRMSKRRNVRTELRNWMDAHYRKDPGLRSRVDALVEELSIEQDLVALREARGLSQRALASLIGVKQPVIARIESGKAKNLELKTLVRLAAALGARVKIKLEPGEARLRAKSTKRKLAETAWSAFLIHASLSDA